MKTPWQFIRSMIASILLAAIAVGVAPSLPAQESTPAGKPLPKAAREEAKQRRAKLPFAKGTLLVNDVLRRTINLQTEDGTRKFIYTDRTYIFRGKEKIPPDKLIVGEIIALRFYTDDEGRSVVRRIKAYGLSSPAVEPPGPS